MDVSLVRDRQLVELAASGLADLTRGLEHPRLDTARARLGEAGTALTRARGSLSVWARTWIPALVIGSGVWLTAAVARHVIGLPSGWVIAFAGVAFLALAVLMDRLGEFIDAHRPRTKAEALDEGVPRSLAEVIWLLERARDGISEATRLRLAGHRFAPAARTAAGFDWLRGLDSDLFYLSHADRCLCQAIDSLEIWRTRPDAQEECEVHS